MWSPQSSRCVAMEEDHITYYKKHRCFKLTDLCHQRPPCFYLFLLTLMRVKNNSHQGVKYTSLPPVNYAAETKQEAGGFLAVMVTEYQISVIQ